MDFKQYDKNNLIYFPCNGKHAIVPAWQKLTKSKKENTATNYGILCGKASNITVIDIDVKGDMLIKSGLKLWTLLKQVFNNCEELETPIVKTGSGGLHLYFKYNSKIKTGTRCVEEVDASGFKYKYSIDIRNDASYVIAPGSVHPDTKKKYRFVQEFDDCYPIDIPEWLFNALTKIIMISNDGITFMDKIKPVKTIDIAESVEYTPDNFNINIFKQIIQNLSVNRSHNYEDWTRVCWGVGGIDKIYKWDNLPELIEFSKKSLKYSDDNEVIKYYNDGDGRIGMGSFWYWLKEDNPTKFNELYKLYRKTQNNPYYYGSYKKLVAKYIENGFLYKAQVHEYLRGAFIKIDNGGNTRWLSRNKDDEGLDDWKLIYNKPFSDNKIKIKLKPIRATVINDDINEEEEQYINSSISDILQEYSVHPEFPIYDKLDFRPYLYDDDKNYEEGEIFNLFNGFPHKPEGDYDMDIIEPILYHMKNILSGVNGEFYEYYINYLAHAIQYPREKPGIAIIIISGQGLGKDIINHDFLKKVFGAKLLHRVNDVSAITRKFNKKLEGKLMTIIGEVRTYCNEIDIENLKGMITNNTINIEPKNVDPYEIKDYQRFIFHTNNSIPLAISPDDRRFIIHKVDKEFIQPREYYNKLSEIIKKPETALHFFKYLAQKDLSGFDIRDRVNTIAKKELQILTASNVYRFMSDIYNKRWTLVDSKITVKKSGEDEIKIHTNNFYDNYTNWILQMGEKGRLSLKMFKQKLKEKDFNECEKQFIYNGRKGNGYKTSYDEIYQCFKEYITKKNIDEDDEDTTPQDDDDE